MAGVDTCIRLIHTAKAVPTRRWALTAEIHERLKENGYLVSRRTVERDLMKLSTAFGLDIRGGGGNVYEWRRTRSLEEVA